MCKTLKFLFGKYFYRNQNVPRPISTLVSPFKVVGRPPIPFDSLVFDRLELEDVRLNVDDFRKLEAEEDPVVRLPFVGDVLRDGTGEEEREFGLEDGLEEGRDRESYGVTQVAGCERLRLGVVGLERILGDLFIEARLEALLGEFGPMLVVGELRLTDEPESLPNRKFGLEPDRRSGLRLPAPLDPWLDRRDRGRLRPFELLPLILEFRSCLSCLARRFAIS